MNKIIRPKLYFVIFISTFISYIYLQNVRIINKLEANFSCKIVSGRVDKCISNKKLTIDAVISSEPYQSGSYLIYKTDDINILFDRDEDVFVGDKVRVVGNLEKRLIKPGYIDKRLISEDILYISRGKDDSVYSPLNWLYNMSKLSKHLRLTIDKLLPPTYSKLVAGILFGSRENIPITLYNNLINTGTIHIIAASGYNISIIAGFVMSVLSKMFKRSTALLFAIISILFFVVISGGGEAVVRAAIMGIIAFGSQYFGKLYTSLYSLATTVIIMLIFDPTLVMSVSFQLSVTSTLGILIIGSKLNSGFASHQKGSSSTINDSNTLRALLTTIFYDFSTTFSATIATLPIILFHFGRISLLTLVVNMLVLWTIPPIMLFGSLMTMFGTFSSIIPRFVAYLLWPFLTYFTQVVSWFGNLPYASFELSWFNEYMVFGYYALLYSVVTINRKKMPINE